MKGGRRIVKRGYILRVNREHMAQIHKLKRISDVFHSKLHSTVCEGPALQTLNGPLKHPRPRS